MTGSVQGRIDVRGDSDWYRVQFEAGKTYQIQSGNDGPFLKLMLPDGTEYSPPVAYANEITFVAPVSGDYWLAVSDSYFGMNFYSINAYEIADANPASLATALTLAVGETVTMNNVVADDWYAVDLTAGQSYFMTTELVDDLYIVDAQGNMIGDVSSYQLHFTPAASGRYYVGHHSFSNSRYSLSLDAVADDYGTSAAAAGMLTVGQTVAGVWETGADCDWFAVNLVGGVGYRFRATVPGEAGHSGIAQIFDAAGNLLASGADGFPSVDFEAISDGTYYVAVNTGTEYYNPFGNWHYNLTATVLPVTPEPPSTLLAIGGTVVVPAPGTVGSDRYRVTLEDGQSYSFMASGGVGPNGPRFTLLDANGNFLSSETDFGTTSTIFNVGVGQTGTYYLIVDGDAGYTLSSQALPDDYLASSLTTGRLEVGGIVAGRLEGQGDKDWFAIDLTAHKSYTFSSEDGGVRITIRDAQGQTLNSDGWWDQHVSVSASGTYYLEVTGGETDYVVGIAELINDVAEDTTSLGIIGNRIVGSDTEGDRFVSTSNHDFFIGRGGDDLFLAGAGHDRYIGGLGIDRVTFAGAEAGVTVDLSQGGLLEDGALRIVIAEIEIVEGSGFADRLTGDDSANRLLGGQGNDVLEGGAGDDLMDGGAGADLLVGGLGSDVMKGGHGADVYEVEDAGDTVIEVVTGGIDEVRTDLLVYALSANVERLTGTNTAGQALTGNAGANRILAAGGSDVINGGRGADVMSGGAGNDIYYVDNVGDVVVEAKDGGVDQVNAGVDYTLGAYLEKLNLLGSGAINGTGNALDNSITGNAGANILRGMAGNDVMTGRGGADQFWFETALSAAKNVDRITDFSVIDDSIMLDDAVFGAIGPAGALAVGAFRIGAGAADADDRIIYNSISGHLLYDADGSGAGAAQLFAVIGTGLVLTNADFFVV
ncbi:hypothetical protein GGR44_000511 [Sphingobium fontiphilum]|uniref:Calcium-binding protein n=1 Tax=Sphingobium fontiphilum TaxID=944425 RepID=A0A7W6DHU5_9SPHN|nr:calcium-binding protein [Sphingobium fontiphilum]MBB3980880.1 hypothetical protein [Sphingobium fontiphilum]